jgi:hypothetical protein
MISAEKWDRVKTIFNQVRELDAVDRGDNAREACGGDEEVWAELERLLPSLEQVAGFIEEPIFAAGASYSGKKIGNYRVEREIGRGGMGVVLLAAREGGEFEQQVAIKVLKRGIDSDEIVSIRNVRYLPHCIIPTLPPCSMAAPRTTDFRSLLWSMSTACS